jgi:hypothetical protein
MNQFLVIVLALLLTATVAFRVKQGRSQINPLFGGWTYTEVDDGTGWETFDTSSDEKCESPIDTSCDAYGWTQDDPCK